MPDLLIVSDTHGRRERLRLLLDRRPLPDAVAFLGDGAADFCAVMAAYPDLPAFAVRGNCDPPLSFRGRPLPETLVAEFAGLRLFLTHGHRQAVKSTHTPLLAAARDAGCDAALFGHTHRPFSASETVDGRRIELCNPGSLGRPGDGTPSFGCLSVRAGQMLFGLGALTEK
ncbi:MAG: YfcE family phosphodiesterase [Clostridia bacterium]|nr:YfcE family phosphodiesterase [Clostridia bacterium]